MLCNDWNLVDWLRALLLQLLVNVDTVITIDDTLPGDCCYDCIVGWWLLTVGIVALMIVDCSTVVTVLIPVIVVNLRWITLLLLTHCSDCWLLLCGVVDRYCWLWPDGQVLDCWWPLLVVLVLLLLLPLWLIVVMTWWAGDITLILTVLLVLLLLLLMIDWWTDCCCYCCWWLLLLLQTVRPLLFIDHCWCGGVDYCGDCYCHLTWGVLWFAITLWLMTIGV